MPLSSHSPSIHSLPSLSFSLSFSRVSLSRSSPSCRWWVVVTLLMDHYCAVGWITVLLLMGHRHVADGLRHAIGWIAAVLLGRSLPCLPFLGGSWLCVARFCGGFGCWWVCSWLVLAFDGLDWWLMAMCRLVKNMGFVGLWWWIVAGGRLMVGFAMDWLWTGGWVGLTQ